MADAANPLSTWMIFGQAIKISVDNWALILPITQLYVLSSHLLFLSNYYSLHPLLLDLFANLYVMRSANPNQVELLTTAAIKDLTKITLIEAIFILTSFIISSLLHITTINVTAKAYCMKHQPTAEEWGNRVRISWRGPVITILSVGLLGFVCMVLVLTPVVFHLWLSDGSMCLTILTSILSISLLLVYVSLAALGWLSVTVSVLEDGCYGRGAVEKATELMKERRSQGIALTATMTMSNFAVYGAYTFSTAFIAQVTSNPLANGLITVNVSALCNVIVLAAFTVFYYECRRSQGEEERAILPCHSHLSETTDNLVVVVDGKIISDDLEGDYFVLPQSPG